MKRTESRRQAEIRGPHFTAWRLIEPCRAFRPRGVINADTLDVLRRGRHEGARTTTHGNPGSHALAVKLHWAGTELLRPLVGQPKFVERAGDYVLPLTLFWLARSVLPAARDAEPGGHLENRAREEAPLELAAYSSCETGVCEGLRSHPVGLLQLGAVLAPATRTSPSS